MIIGFKEKFKNKDELIKLGVDGLYNNFLTVIKDINLGDYLVEFGWMHKKYAELFGFKSHSELKRYNKVSSNVLINEFILHTLCENIITQARDSNTLVGNMFCSWDGCYKDLEIGFKKSKDVYGHYTIVFGLMSYSKTNGCGSGDSVRILLTNKNIYEKEIEKIKRSNLDDKTKEYITNYFKEEANTREINLNKLLLETKEAMLDDIKYFLEEECKGSLDCISLKDKGFSKELFECFSEWVHNFDKEIIIHYKEKNIVEVYFCKERIKTIKKYSYTAYGIF